jgi:hypothetical protein
LGSGFEVDLDREEGRMGSDVEGFVFFRIGVRIGNLLESEDEYN